MTEHTTQKKILWREPEFSIIVLLIFHIIGVIGIKYNIVPGFVMLTPLNLLLSVGLVIWHDGNAKDNIIKFGIPAFLIGYFAEMIGVQTGMIFGEYAYGPVLGPQIKGTPLMIGVNWLMLSMCAGSLVNNFFGNLNIILKTIIASLALVLLDLYIEPVAIAYDFWSWGGAPVPLQNYVGWFFVGLPILFVYFKLMTVSGNKVAQSLFFIQLAFFMLLQPN